LGEPDNATTPAPKPIPATGAPTSPPQAETSQSLPEVSAEETPATRVEGAEQGRTIAAPRESDALVGQ